MHSRATGIVRQTLLTVVSLIALLPLYIMFSGALKTRGDFLDQPLAPPWHPTLNNFSIAFEDELLLRWFLNSVVVTSLSVLITVAMAALAAWGFARIGRRLGGMSVRVIASLMVLPPSVLIVSLFSLGADLGLLNTYQLVIVVYAAFMLPFSIYLLYTFFRAIPTPLLEAARVEGASDLYVFRRVVLPLSRAPLLTLVVVNGLWAWNELLLAVVLLQDNTKQTLMVGLVGFQSRQDLNVPVVLAGLSVATIPLIALYLFSQRSFVRGLTAGAVKG